MPRHEHPLAFRPEFKVAFDAWMATDPLHNPWAAPGPTYVPQHKPADQAKADALDREAEAASAAATHAGLVSDEYIRSRCSWLRCCS